MRKHPIDAGSWKALSGLLDQALELPAPALEGWLDALAPEFDAVKPQLRRMLARHAQVETNDFLNALPSFEVADPDAAPAEKPGDVIGPYTLEHELGSGGMGVVWLAKRTDGLIPRPVALKLPHGAWRRAGLVERMTREREILASLTHPNIARLYDAGVTAAGQPWLAIEYIEGKRIDEYCRDRRMPVRDRLRLFVQAANAVAYAHAKLVVHRDLKPANILVAPDGQVHLLDFGIARLLEDGEARESPATQMTGAALTPDYASPEQITGAPITIASDVYSLGVILYELLCDQRPYRLQRDSRGALEDAILQADPPLPSTLVHRRRAAMRGDLDTVVMKALKKQPEERYATVHALVDDIERYLGNQPVLARRDSRGYRARKFIARHKFALSATTAIVMAVIAGAVVSLWQARVAVAQKNRAEEVQSFIASVFSEADPMMQSEGKALSAVELLRQAEQRIEQRTDTPPSLKVEMLAIISESLFGLQENKEAARVASAALKLQASLPDADPALTARLHLALSKALEYTGDVDSAVTELDKSFDALKAVDKPGALAVRARLHQSALGLTTGDYEQAERAANQAIAEAAPLLGARSDEVAVALMFLSKAYLFSERTAESVAPARQGLDILLANHHEDYAHPKLIEFAPYYANALIHTGDFDAAAQILHDVITNAERVYGAQSNIVGELSSVAVPAELERGELDAGIALARRSIDNYLREAAPGTSVHAYRARILGLALVVARTDDAVSTLEESARISDQAGDPPYAGRANLGLALAHAGRLDEADKQLRIALDGAKPGTYGFARVARNLGMVLRFRHLSDRAIPWLEQSVAGFAKDRADRGEHATSLVELGLTRLDLGRLDAAQEAFMQARTELESVQKERMTPTRADLLIGAARVSLARGNPAKALPDLQRADAYWRERRPDSRWAGEAALWLGRAQLVSGQRADARASLARAAKLLGKSKIPADETLLRLARAS